MFEEDKTSPGGGDSGTDDKCDQSGKGTCSGGGKGGGQQGSCPNKGGGQGTCPNKGSGGGNNPSCPNKPKQP